MLLPLVINLSGAAPGVGAGGNILGLLFPLDIDIALAPGAVLRVQAVGIGFYNGVLYGPGDVFDTVQGAFSDSSIDPLAGFAGGPDFGWMKQVPPSTPLTHPDIPLYDFPSKRRT